MSDTPASDAPAEPPPSERQAADVRLTVRGVAKRFGAVRAIRNADLSVDVGEVHALVGENGAGKSTLIKVLSGAETADTGEISFEGRPVTIATTADASALGIATVYQEPQLFPDLTVAQSVFTGRETSRPRKACWDAQNARVGDDPPPRQGGPGRAERPRGGAAGAHRAARRVRDRRGERTVDRRAAAGL